MRLPRARCRESSFKKSSLRLNPLRRSSSSSSPSSSDGGGEECEGAAGRRRGCLAAILGRVLGAVTVDMVVDVPAPARRRAGAVVVGRVVVEVTGHGRLVDDVATGGGGSDGACSSGRDGSCSRGGRRDWWCGGRVGQGGSHSCHMW